MVGFNMQVEDLPITPYLDSICTSLKNSPSRCLVLTAQTAAGKSTVLPLALLKNFSGNIIMLEPRRLAVLGIANRVASLLEQEPGQTCGYQMHLESKVSEKTRFTVVTEAILIRKLQNDPLLEGISVIVIDEFHERSLHADLALAFLKETLSLRTDLYVLVMSATMQTKQLCQYLSAPLVQVPGKQFEVNVEYEDSLTMSQAIRKEILHPHDQGTILAFLPGIKEIRKTKDELEDIIPNTEICILHSSVDFAQQKRIFEKSNGTKRRVILSSAIAETSLTVPDVTVVIDSGLSRISQYNARLGMEELVTVQSSQFNAQQRAGRAGRVKAGTCIRLYNKHDVRQLASQPQILTSDLTSLVLECMEWGSGTDRTALQWLDVPPLSAWNSAVSLLNLLACIKDGHITELGKACLLLGINVRLACVVLSGLPFGKEKESVRIASQFSKDFEIKEIEHRLSKIDKKGIVPQGKCFSTEYALLCGFPDRIARCDNEEGVYQFSSGRKAVLTDAKRPFAKYIVAPSVDAGETTGRIYAFTALSNAVAEAFMQENSVINERSWIEEGSQKLRSVQECAFGKLVLWKKDIKTTAQSYIQAVSNEVLQKGLNWLPLSDSSQDFLLRTEFFVQHASVAGYETDELKEKLETLEQRVSEWLGPFISEGTKLSDQIVYEALAWYLDAQTVNKMVPKTICLTEGTKPKKICYTKQNEIIPTIEIIIQQAFGCFTTPQILGVPILFKLLSPARRPLQVTSDLEHFWEETWPEICKEMKARYPKHNWNYRIAEKSED